MVCLSCSFTFSNLIGCVGIFHNHSENPFLTVLSVSISGGKNCTGNDVMTEGQYHYSVFGLSEAGLEEAPVNKDSIQIKKLPTTTMILEDSIPTDRSQLIFASRSQY